MIVELLSWLAARRSRVLHWEGSQRIRGNQAIAFRWRKAAFRLSDKTLHGVCGRIAVWGSRYPHQDATSAGDTIGNLKR